MTDTIDHPQHYYRWPMEVIEFIAVNNLPWWLANVLKYCIRHDAKDGLQDLYKARSYLEMKIRQLEGHPRFWDKPVSEQRQLSMAKEIMTEDKAVLAKMPDVGDWDHRTSGQASFFPNKALMPKAPAVFCAGNAVDLLGVVPMVSARYCACGVNITSQGFACWDDDCEHKQKSGGSIHTKVSDR